MVDMAKNVNRRKIMKRISRKIVSAFLSLVLLFGMTGAFSGTSVIAADGLPFKDVKADAWFYDAVSFVYNNGIMNGTSDDTFSPNAKTNRAMVVTVLYRLENEPEINVISPFKDLKQSWYIPAVNWAYENEIVKGMSETTFSPTGNITREQMATILFRYSQYKGYDTSASNDLKAYTDAGKVSSWALEAMKWANGTGLITGMTIDTLVPGGASTRAQLATILQRFIDFAGTDPMYAAVENFESKYASGGTVNMSMGSGEMVDHDYMSSVILELLGLDPEKYTLDVDVYDFEAFIGLYKNTDIGKYGNCPVTFGVYNKDTFESTDKIDVTFTLQKMYGLRDYTFENSNSVVQRYLNATRKTDSLVDPDGDGFIDIVLGDASLVTRDDIAGQIVGMFNTILGYLDIVITDEDSYMDNFSEDSDYDRLADGKTMEISDDFTFTIVEPNDYYTSQVSKDTDHTYKLRVTKDCASKLDEVLPENGKRFNIYDSIESENDLCEYLKTRISEDYGIDVDPLTVSDGYEEFSEAYASPAGTRTECNVTVMIGYNGTTAERTLKTGIIKQPEADDSYGFAFTKDSVPVSTIIVSDGVSQRQYDTAVELRDKINELTGANIRIAFDNYDDKWGSLILIGPTDYVDYSLLGESSITDMVIAKSGDDLSLNSTTSNATVESVGKVMDSLKLDETNDVLYIDSEVFGIFERELPETYHAYDKFELTFYGPPYITVSGDEWTYTCDEYDPFFSDGLVPVSAAPDIGEENEAVTMDLIAYLNESGQGVCLYGFPYNGTPNEDTVKEIINKYGDIEGVVQWGIVHSKDYSQENIDSIIAMFQENDEQNRPVRHIAISDATYEGVGAFGVDQIPIWTSTDDASVTRTRALVEKLWEIGVSTRIYAFPTDEDIYLETKDISPDEEKVLKVIECYGDLEGVTEWGLVDEPKVKDHEYFGLCAALFHKHDPRDRDVYINLDPAYITADIEEYRQPHNYYDSAQELMNPDYYCFDRYPFFVIDQETGEGGVVDKYFYYNFEINKQYALDNGRDASVILAAIRVGNDPARTEVDGDMMDWQTNLMIAYDYRCWESYVYYHVHPSNMLGDGNIPTWRWYNAQRRNEYLNTVGDELSDSELQAVFHLPYEDGSYSYGVIPYYGYKGLGEVIGYDAILSFKTDGTFIVTDKRCSDFDGGEHEITFTGLSGEGTWFNPDTAQWEDISTCPAVLSTDGGLRICLGRATQFVFRPVEFQ